jgi:hypothetical protein
MKETTSTKVRMTPEEQAIVNKKLTEVAEILYKNTSPEKLKTFETIELSVREHLLEKCSSRNWQFFFVVY